MIRSGVVSAANAASRTSNLVNQSSDTTARVSSSIQVQLDPLSGCGACSASGGCGVQLLPVAQTPLLVDCQLPAGVVASVGDRVQVQLGEPGSGWLQVVALAYGGPTIGMIIGVLLGFWSSHALHMPQFSESFSLAGFVVGLAGGLIAWSRAENAAPKRKVGENQPQIHKVIQER